MPKPNLLDELAKHPLLCDGAMGTQLIAAGLPPGGCGELWNVERPQVVQAVHASYLNAGCDLVTANTFGGSKTALDKYGLGARVAELNRAGARLAQAAAGELSGRTAWVLGNIGPFGGFLEPAGEVRAEDLRAIFVEQAAALAEGGVDAFIIETMADPAEMALAIQAARQVSRLPIMATYAFDHIEEKLYCTMAGARVQEAIQIALQAGADAVGANCGGGLAVSDYCALSERILKFAGTTPVIIQPNAGMPVLKDGKVVYQAIPADMVELAAGLLNCGARVVGGCCGTTPAHLAAMNGVWRKR